MSVFDWLDDLTQIVGAGLFVLLAWAIITGKWPPKSSRPPDWVPRELTGEDERKRTKP